MHCSRMYHFQMKSIALILSNSTHRGQGGRSSPTQPGYRVSLDCACVKSKAVLIQCSISSTTSIIINQSIVCAICRVSRCR